MKWYSRYYYDNHDILAYLNALEAQGVQPESIKLLSYGYGTNVYYRHTEEVVMTKKKV